MIDIKFLTGSYAKDGLGIYRMHHLYAVLLEMLADRQYYLPNDFWDRITQYMNEEIKWNATMSDIGLAIRYLGLSCCNFSDTPIDIFRKVTA